MALPVWNLALLKLVTHLDSDGLVKVVDKSSPNILGGIKKHRGKLKHYGAYDRNVPLPKS